MSVAPHDGAQVEEELLESVAAAARLVPEVARLSNLRGRVLGPHLLIDMQVARPPTSVAGSSGVRSSHTVMVQPRVAVRRELIRTAHPLTHRPPACSQPPPTARFSGLPLLRFQWTRR